MEQQNGARGCGGGSELERLFPGDSEMDRLMRAHDWSATPVGPVGTWPQSLRTAVSICLGSRYPIVIWWGKPAYTTFYNDAYIPILGVTKHPGWLGRSGRECWSEIWPTMRPMWESVFATGEATWSEDFRWVLDRNLPLEETYFTFSYSPIRDDAGAVGGIFCACSETTSRVIGERRLRTLGELGRRVTDAKRAEAACEVAVQTLAANPADIPFALIYLLEADGKQARLLSATGLTAGSVPAPGRIDVTEPPERSTWPFSRVVATAAPELVPDLVTRFGPLPGGPWPESPRAGLVVPIARPGQTRPTGFLVAGLSPRRVPDADYRTFFDLIAGHLATAVANARAHEEEQSRAEALAELDRAKTAFFSNVSHEFRTPLTLMLGPVEDALADHADPLPPRQRERLEAAHRSSLRLLKLVNTLLDFARIEAGRVQAVYEPTDLAALTAELASNFRSACEKAGLRLVVDCPPLPEPVYVDRDMWEKVVLNLVSNAFKFTFEGEIGVSLRQVEHVAEVRVRDTGTGIPAAELPRVFERFHRVEGSRGRTYEGTGIGLTLVQELVKLHGGTVRVESTCGEGSTFTVSVPTGTSHLPADRIGAARALRPTAVGAGAFIEEVLRWLPSEDDRVTGWPGDSLTEDTRAAPVTLSSSRPRVLWADDNADMRDYVRRLLGEQYDVEAVADGEAALAAARARPPDLVLADVMMPRLDGFGLLRALRADPRTMTTPVILLSARAGEESRTEGLQTGADDYLIKPFSAREVLARVEAQVRLSRLRREVAAVARAGEERLRRILNIDGVGVLVFEASSGTLIDANEAFLAMFGYSREEVAARALTWRTMTPPEYVAASEEQLREFERTGRVGPYEKEYLRKDGSRSWMMLVGANLGDGTFVKYCFDVNDRKRAEAALREADRRKDEFLAMLGHELRNPLAPLRSVTEALQRQKLDGPGLERAYAIMDRQVGHLARLVDDLLDVSRITRGLVELREEPVNLAEAAVRAVEMVTPAVEGRGHDLHLSLPRKPVRVEGDATRLTQVLFNLLNNAAKYTDPGGKIWLTVEREGEEAVVRVRDNGSGMKADLVPKVFDLFTQGDRTPDRSQGGLGLGLTLVKRLVEMHGGRVEAGSEGPGKGSEFVVRLPALREEVKKPPPVRPAGLPPAAVQVDRALVVDDNLDVAESLTWMLEGLARETRMVHSGAAAVETAGQWRPDVIVCDLGMPGMDGYETCRRLRRLPGLEKVVIAAVSGYGGPEDRKKSQEAGFDRHLVKPIGRATLEELVQSAAGA
jgi:PAS domain S-box-containing protein